MHTMKPSFVLASASPRRLALLRGLGLDPMVRAADLHERPVAGEGPEAHVLRLAEAKARRVARGLDGRPSVVLGADTAVVLDGETLGKPGGIADAAGMLARLAGRGHQVLTGVFLLRTDLGTSTLWVERTEVRFRDYGEEMIRWYVETGEPMDKAGAYGIQTRGALLARGIDGSWTNVVGLPVERLPALFNEIDLDFLDYLVSAPAPGAPAGP
jgi:septum formation protein